MTPEKKLQYIINYLEDIIIKEYRGDKHYLSHEGNVVEHKNIDPYSLTYKQAVEISKKYKGSTIHKSNDFYGHNKELLESLMYI